MEAVNVGNLLYVSAALNVVLVVIIGVSARRNRLFVRRKKWTSRLKQMMEETKMLVGE